MAAYAIVQVEVTDPQLMEQYGKVAGATLTEYGGRALVVSDERELIEGTWPNTRTVVLEFPSMKDAKAWYSSEGYAGPKAMRLKAARSNFIFVAGLP